MKYITWQDELRGYLSDMPHEEREKVFSYFSEMYADKRDAGLSEEEIVESFGAPYDVAKRIRSESGLYTKSANDAGNADNLFDAPPQPVPPYSQPAPTPAPAPAKSSGKKAGIIAAVSVFGVILIIVAAILISGAVTAKKIKFDPLNFTAEAAVTSIDVSIAAGEAECYYDDGVEFLTVDYFNSDGFGYKASFSGGKLTLEPVQKSHGLIWSLAMSLRGWDFPKITIKIPASQKVDANVTLSAGTFRLGGGEYGNVKVEMSAGTVNTEKLVCNELDCSVSAGILKASAECSVMNLSLSAGTIKMGEISCNAATVDVSAGSANMSKLTCNDLTVHLSAGSVTANLVGAESDYSISTEVSAGSCNLQNRTVTGAEKFITVTVSAGSVTVIFIN